MTRAEWDSAFDGNGQRWHTLDREHMDDLIARLELRTWRVDGHDLTCVSIDDAEVLIGDGGWDYRHPDCTCGACWADAGEECPGLEEEE